MILVTRLVSGSGLIHFACIDSAPPQLVKRSDQSRGSNSKAGKMDQTWYTLYIFPGLNERKFGQI